MEVQFLLSLNYMNSISISNWKNKNLNSSLSKKHQKFRKIRKWRDWSKRINWPYKRRWYIRKPWKKFVYSPKKIFRYKKFYSWRRNHTQIKSRVKVYSKYRWKFFWRRKKLKQSRRFWFNVAFFLKKRRSKNLFKVDLRKKWSKRIGNPPWSSRPIIILKRRKPRRKLSLRAKAIYKKKIYFKKFIIKHYNFKKIYQLKNLYRWVKKIPGNKITNFFLSLESQLSSVCLRMHFFWRLKTARTWIKFGSVYVNGRLIKYPRHLIKINDLVSVIRYKIMWSKGYEFWLKTWRKKKINRYLNGCELSYKCASAIIFSLPYKIEDIKIILKKRKKHWLKTRVFSFLVNSFH